MKPTNKTTNAARRAWSAARRKHIKRGEVYRIEIRHDPDCLIYTSARICTCNPDRAILTLEGTELACVKNAGPYDPLEMLEVPA
ncbi:MAG: hypothetical protein ACFB01_07115 [Cohaesibacteraceae bacterium]